MASGGALDDRSVMSHSTSAHVGRKSWKIRRLLSARCAARKEEKIALTTILCSLLRCSPCWAVRSTSCVEQEICTRTVSAEPLIFLQRPCKARCLEPSCYPALEPCPRTGYADPPQRLLHSEHECMGGVRPSTAAEDVRGVGKASMRLSSTLPGGEPGNGTASGGVLLEPSQGPTHGPEARAEADAAFRARCSRTFLDDNPPSRPGSVLAIACLVMEACAQTFPPALSASSLEGSRPRCSAGWSNLRAASPGGAVRGRCLAGLAVRGVTT